MVFSQQQREIKGEGKKVWVVVELGFWVCWEGSVEDFFCFGVGIIFGTYI